MTKNYFLKIGFSVVVSLLFLCLSIFIGLLESSMERLHIRD
jgi:hypothetical protein